MGKKNNHRNIKAETFFHGFKDFITRGNVLDLAIGVVIGGAFGKITTSLVNDIIMPPIGLLIGKVDFKDLVWVLKPATLDAAGAIIKPEVAIRYGMFIMVVIEFLIIAFAIYAVINLIIRRRDFLAKIEAEEKALREAEEAKAKKEEEKKKEKIVPEDILLLREIRDSLKEKN